MYGRLKISWPLLLMHSYYKLFFAVGGPRGDRLIKDTIQQDFSTSFFHFVSLPGPLTNAGVQYSVIPQGVSCFGGFLIDSSG